MAWTALRSGDAEAASGAPARDGVLQSSCGACGSARCARQLFGTWCVSTVDAGGGRGGGCVSG
eukprot:1879736-Pleurochrysis_carterae.AAC.1